MSSSARTRPYAVPYGPPRLLLAAPSPDAWLATHLTTHLAEHLGTGSPDDAGATAGGEWVSLDEVLPRLPAMHAVHLTSGAAPQAVAKWLCGWFAGAVADTVAFALATSAAALHVRTEDVRWRLHPDGWPDRTDVAARGVTVAAGHPWAGQPDVEVVATQHAVREVALASVLAPARPLVEASRTLAKAGRSSLWTEVADGIGLALAGQAALVVDPAAAAELNALLRLPGAPWRGLPSLVVADTAVGPAYLAQKGGCCLAYLTPEPEEPQEAPESLEPEPEWMAYQRAYDERFPHLPGAPHYCSTCSLLSSEDCRARQRFWVEFHRTEPAAGGADENG